MFFGTPDFAVPSLDAVASEHEVALVVAQPDRPAGRGMKMQPPAVAVRARELGLPLLQPSKIRTEEFLDTIGGLGVQAGVVVAYGRILPSILLSLCPRGFFNVHGSILPRWRGAAPIQRAIEAGDTETGVTIMRVDEQLDHGPMLRIATTEIGPDERTPALAKRLAAIGADALTTALGEVADGTAVETPQDHSRATVAPKIEKHEGAIRLDEPARVIYDRFRAFDPWPGIFLESGVKLTEIRRAHGEGAPRTILAIDNDGVTVACGEGAIRIVELQRAGKPRTPAAALARGLGWRVGSVIPSVGEGPGRAGT